MSTEYGKPGTMSYDADQVCAIAVAAKLLEPLAIANQAPDDLGEAYFLTTRRGKEGIWMTHRDGFYLGYYVVDPDIGILWVPAHEDVE